MANQLKTSIVFTSVAILTPFKFGTTPLLGGQGREAFLTIPGTMPTTGVAKLQGAPVDPASGTTPVSGSPLWTDILTINSASDRSIEVADLPLYGRWNVTTSEAVTVPAYFQGVQ